MTDTAASHYTKDTVLQETIFRTVVRTFVRTVVRCYTKGTFFRHYTEETVARIRVMPLQTWACKTVSF